MKVGDLVRMTGDPPSWNGHGVVLKIGDPQNLNRGSQGPRHPDSAKIHWFDDWDDDPVEWVRFRSLEVRSEGG